MIFSYLSWDFPVLDTMSNSGLYPGHFEYYIIKLWVAFKSSILTASQPIRFKIYVLAHSCRLWLKCQFSLQSPCSDIFFHLLACWWQDSTLQYSHFGLGSGRYASLPQSEDKRQGFMPWHTWRGRGGVTLSLQKGWNQNSATGYTGQGCLFITVVVRCGSWSQSSAHRGRALSHYIVWETWDSEFCPHRLEKECCLIIVGEVKDWPLPIGSTGEGHTCLFLQKGNRSPNSSTGPAGKG